MNQQKCRMLSLKNSRSLFKLLVNYVKRAGTVQPSLFLPKFPLCFLASCRNQRVLKSSRLRSGAMKAPVGLLSDRTVLRSKMEGRCPDKLGGICDKGYHGLRSASRWFCKFYCSKAVIVGLIFNTQQETISVSHIVMFAEKTYNAFEPVGHTKRRKERES